jgi:hypothetical protein
MNHDEQNQLERLLQTLPLRRPSDRLDPRVAAIWDAGAVRWKRLGLGAAAAAALAVAAGLLGILAWNVGLLEPGPPEPTSERPSIASSLPPASPGAEGRASGSAAEDRFPPVRIEQVWSELKDEEVVPVDDAPPMRRVHQRVFRHVRWIDEPHEVRIEWTVPSEEVVLAPLEYN